MGEMMGAERFRGRKRVAHDSTATEVSVRGFLGGGAATVPSARRFRKRPSQGSEKLRLDIILIKPKIAFYYMSGDKLGWLTTDMVMGKKNYRGGGGPPRLTPQYNTRPSNEIGTLSDPLHP